MTQYLDRIAELERRVQRIEKQQITRDEVTRAWDSHRQLYSDLFEETHELKERLWTLGACQALTQTTPYLLHAHAVSRYFGTLRAPMRRRCRRCA